MFSTDFGVQNCATSFQAWTNDNDTFFGTFPHVLVKIYAIIFFEMRRNVKIKFFEFKFIFWCTAVWMESHFSILAKNFLDTRLLTFAKIAPKINIFDQNNVSIFKLPMKTFAPSTLYEFNAKKVICLHVFRFTQPLPVVYARSEVAQWCEFPQYWFWFLNWTVSSYIST